MATYSSVLAWRIPGTGEPGGLPSMGSQSRTRLKRPSNSSSSSRNLSVCSVKNKALSATHCPDIGMRDCTKITGVQQISSITSLSQAEMDMKVSGVCFFSPHIMWLWDLSSPYQGQNLDPGIESTRVLTTGPQRILKSVFQIRFRPWECQHQV